MKRFCSAILFIFTLNAALPSEGTAAEGYRLAYSRQMGIEVFVESPTSAWCDTILHLRVVARNPHFFSSDGLTRTMGKLRKILAKDCPSAQLVGLTGFTLAQKTPVFRGTAAALDDWRVRETQREREDAKQADSASPSSFLLNDFTHFTVSGWTPLTKGASFEVIGADVYDQEIRSKDGRCALRYTLNRPSAKTQGWHLEAGGNACENYFLDGAAEIEIKNAKNQLVAKGAGFFTDGFFTQDQRFEVSFQQRYAFGADSQRLNFLIDSDPFQKVHYVSYLRSEYRPKYGKYTKWHGCDPVVIAAVTDNQTLFLDESEIADMLEAAQDYGAALCPRAATIEFYGVNKPSGIPFVDLPEAYYEEQAWKTDPAFWYGQTLVRNLETGRWFTKPESVRNRVKILETVRLAEQAVEGDYLSKEYDRLELSDTRARLAYLHDVSSLDNPFMILAATAIHPERAVFVNVRLHIESSDGQSARADWPLPLVVSCKNPEFCRPGWYVMGGFLAPLSAAEKSVHALPANAAAGKFAQESITRCTKAFCSETASPLALIRRRHRAADLSPLKKKEDKP